MGALQLLSLFLFCLVQFTPVTAIGFAEELYCGLENCYDVLEIDREVFDRSKLSKIYRTFAKKYHPDRFKDSEDKKAAEVKFRVVATAYETLKDEEARSEYDYYLDHPEERFYNYYQYYRRRYNPKVDPRIVIIGTILAISLFQFYSAKQKYGEALAYAVTVGKYRNMAINMGVQRKLLDMDNKTGKLKKLKGRDNEAIIRSIIEENMDVRGGYAKESVYDTLAWHVIKLPVTVCVYGKWAAAWTLKYWVQKQEYDREAQLYLIRKHLGLGEAQFNCMSEEEHEDMLDQQLWHKDKFSEWKAARDAEEKEKLAQSGKYKRYRRFLKNNSGNTISFLDEE